MSCGFEGCVCGDPLNHPRDHVAESEARRDALPTYRRRSRLPWHTSSRAHIDSETNPHSDGAQEGNDGWANGRGNS